MEHPVKERHTTPDQTTSRARRERRKPPERSLPGQPVRLVDSVRAAESGDGAELRQTQIQNLQRTIGNRSVGHLLAHGQQAPKVQRAPLTAEEQALNLQSPRYASNETLQNAYDNNPPLRQGASGEAVVLVQQGLIDAGIPLPLSTNNGAEPPDGIYGSETAGAVRQLQEQNGFDRDGVVGRQTMGKLDQLGGGARTEPPTDRVPPTEIPPLSTPDLIISVLESAPGATLRTLSGDIAFLNNLQTMMSAAQFGRAAACFCVITPDGVQNPTAATAEARRIVSTQLAGDKAVTRRAIDRVRATIIPANMLMTDIAPFTVLRGTPTFDGRTWDTVRGVGNVVDGEIAYSAFTEDNLLGVPCTATYTPTTGDNAGVPQETDWRYPEGYSTSSHEFAHSMETAALTDADRSTILTAYNARKVLSDASPNDPDMWVDGRRGCYASQNEAEFYAQLSNAYLGTNTGTDASTGDTRHNSKEWVQSHEPTVFALLERIYTGGALANTNPAPPPAAAPPSLPLGG
ncbi:MAG: peptidoglycan-binding domain-containing protein [Anaerolineae bacterium]